VVIVAPASHVQQCRTLLTRQGPVDVAHDVARHVPVDAAHNVAQHVPVDVPVDVVVGGVDRSASVKAGLMALSQDDGIVLVHDVARCLAPSELFARVIQAVRAGHAAVVPGLPVTDTVRVVDTQGRVLDTPDRGGLRGIQTPQGFRREVLDHAHARAGTHSAGAGATDDAGLVEQAGGQVRVVPGEPRALKITSPLDLTVATALLDGDRHAG
jgi:2-C-methyl-D-erythritol 4-phosphate cytidylyltransferase